MHERQLRCNMKVFVTSIWYTARRIWRTRRFHVVTSWRFYVALSCQVRDGKRVATFERWLRYDIITITRLFRVWSDSIFYRRVNVISDIFADISARVSRTLYYISRVPSKRSEKPKSQFYNKKKIFKFDFYGNIIFIHLG